MPIGVYQHKKGYKRPPISEDWRKNLSISHLGQTAWNKGIKGFLAGEKHWHFGQHWSDKIKEKISLHRKGKMIGDSHPQWKGDNAKYRSLHQRLGKAPICDYCGSVGGKHGTHWANLTGKYTDITDYLPLCPKHHKEYDIGKLFIWQMPESLRVAI